MSSPASPARPPRPARPGGDRDPAGGGRVAMVAGGLMAAFGVLYLGAVVGSGDGVPAGTTVNGVDIGGQSVAEATATLDKALGPVSRAPMVATVPGQRFTVVPSRSGMHFDPAATAASVSGRQWNPFALLARFGGSHEAEPVVTIDQAALTTTVTRLAKDVDVAPVAADVVVKGTTPSVVAPADGTAVQVPESVAALSAAYLHGTSEVPLPVATVPPAVSQDEADSVLRDVATPALAAPVTVIATGAAGATATATVSPEVIGSVLSFQPKDATLVPVIDGVKLRAAVAPSLASVEKQGRDATFVIRNGSPQVVPSVLGFGVTPAALASGVTGVLTKGAGERTVPVTLGRIDPTLTTAQAKALGVKQKVSEYVQHFPYAAYRVQNIGQAAKYINGTLLEPGQTFSMNDTIKERTAENGYTKGFVIGEGGIFKMDEGGGVSTATTTMFNAAWFAGLKLTEHRAHSIWIPDRYKPGREATVSWGNFDMKFTNNTRYGIYITTEMSDTSMTATLWSTKVYDDVGSSFGPFRGTSGFPTLYNDTSTCHAQNGVEGFTITVLRTWSKGGKKLPPEAYTTTYSPSPTVICGPDPSKVKPTPKPGATGTAKPTATPTGKPTGKPSGTPTVSPSTG